MSRSNNGFDMDVLDRPILAALQTRQSRFAVSEGSAIRYQDDVSPFAATADDSRDALQALARLIAKDRIAVLLQAGEAPASPCLAIVQLETGVQMVAASLVVPRLAAVVEDLGEKDVEQMRSLAALTKPGPFLPRTHELGPFIGIRQEGRLVAMAGERMQLPGFTEVSGVCTHPDFRGRGYGAHLTSLVAKRIASRGETPFLHAFAQNHAAIRVYESIGFRLRRQMTVAVLRNASAPSVAHGASLG